MVMARLVNLFNNGDEDLVGAKTSIRRYGDIEEIIDAVETTFHEFENFSMVQKLPFDHHFIYKKPSKMNNILVENIKREWDLISLCFEESSTYVRTYKERPDLMRAMMVGPEGTPYHHGLFFFDILIPTNYPTKSPQVFYRSYGHDLNPNLNEMFNLSASDGDKGFIKFNSDHNTNPMRIVQILSIIQNSFFVKNPREEEYQKQVLKPTSEAILCLLKSPPQSFEVFVYGYFRTRAHQILMNYKSHMALDETTTRLFFKLIRAFEANGTYCQHHYNKESYERAQLEEMLHEQKKATKW